MILFNVLKYNLLLQRNLKTLFYFTFFSLIFSFCIFYKESPEKIPLHFDLVGNLTRMGDKAEWIIVVSLWSFISITIFILHKLLHRVNYPLKFLKKSKGSVFVLFLSFILLLSNYMFNYVLFFRQGRRHLTQMEY